MSAKRDADEAEEFALMRVIAEAIDSTNHSVAALLQIPGVYELLAEYFNNEALGVAGSGQHSHEVPSAIGRVVLIRDGGHNGTEVYRTEDGYRWVNLDQRTVYASERCVLVRLAVNGADNLVEPYGCDLESPSGLALVGLDLGEELDADLGEILWDSACTQASV